MVQPPKEEDEVPRLEPKKPLRSLLWDAVWRLAGWEILVVGRPPP